MPAISYDGFAAWSNYHLTLGDTPPANPVPAMTVESLGRVHAADAATLPGLARFAATAVPLMKHLAKLRDIADPPAPQPSRRFAAGLTGRGWSFTPLIGARVSQLVCDGLAGTAALEEADRDPACPVPVERIALTSGGTRLRELVNWSEGRDLTIRTSGTHLGATVAGAAATASHGSRIGFGGIQDMILGMHLIVGDAEHVWIERASCPVLGDAGVAQLAVENATLRVVRDDAQFADALVHLGAMGIVNGVAIELVPNATFALLRRFDKLDATWLDDLAHGAFGRIAARLGCAVPPEFYEITLNPHAPFDDDATHMMYLPRTVQSLLPPEPLDIVRPSDAIVQLGDWLIRAAAAPASSAAKLLDDPTDPPTAVTRVLRRLLRHDSAFSYYRTTGGFEANVGTFDPDDPGVPASDWSGLHSDEITGNIPGALYNASYAIPRDRLAAAVPAICAAVAGLEPSFVFSLRFVSNPGGTLAFTRFAENAVIEIDGLSPLICAIAGADVKPDEPDAAELLAALGRLGKTLEKGAMAVRAGLDAAGIPYSMHWAKLGNLDQAKVHADFGPPGDAGSRLRRWRDTRDALLPPLGRMLFWNDHLVALGVLDAPSPAVPA